MASIPTASQQLAGQPDPNDPHLLELRTLDPRDGICRVDQGFQYRHQVHRAATPLQYRCAYPGHRETQTDQGWYCIHLGCHLWFCEEHVNQYRINGWALVVAGDGATGWEEDRRRYAMQINQ